MCISSGVWIYSVFLVPWMIAATFAWLMLRRRSGGVYFALITQALALAFATLLISQQGTTGGFNGLTDYHMLLGFNLNDDAVTVAIYFITLAFVVGSFFGLRCGAATRRAAQIGRAPSELQSLMRISYAVFCLKKKKNNAQLTYTTTHTTDNYQ